MIYLIVLILPLVLLKVYNKVNCGWCYAKTIMTGKVVIVTGANTGIGYETALNMAKRDAKVILACRDMKKTADVVEKIITLSKNTKVYSLHLDLCSLESVRRFVKEFGEKENKLDVLVNNAGASGNPGEYSDDGIVKTMQTNHFGPFLLTVLLVPFLKRAEKSRVVMVASDLHKLGRLNFDTLNKIDNSVMGVPKFYNCSKLCNVLFANELARRLKHDDIMVNSLHPGVVNTDIFRCYGGIRETLIKAFVSLFLKSPIEGAQTTIYLCVADIDTTGGYFVDCKLATPSKMALNKHMAQKLWQYSENLVRLDDSEKIR